SFPVITESGAALEIWLETQKSSAASAARSKDVERLVGELLAQADQPSVYAAGQIVAVLGFRLRPEVEWAISCRWAFTVTGKHCQLSRGDRTAIELFVAGIQGWETGLRRRIGLQIQ